MGLPVLDASLFIKGSGEQRRSYASELHDSLAKHGFVKLINHGLTNEQVSEIFQWNKRFFELPIEKKAEIAHRAGPTPQRGWSCPGAENSSNLYRKGILGNDDTIDLKDSREHFDQGPSTDSQFLNRWPDEKELPGFRKFMEALYAKFEEICALILEALELSLGLPSGILAQMCSHEHSASELRFNHYPEISLEDIRRGTVNRIWPHFDLGVITLLFQDGIGGLEFEDRDRPGTFLPVDCGAPSELVVNISETFQRWTNNGLRAGLHTVNIPPSMKAQQNGVIRERYSVAYFCKADRNVSVGPFPQFKEIEKPSQYDDVTALEYQQRRLLSAY